jgi:polar amino acid transport system substrate-binding protein
MIMMLSDYLPGLRVRFRRVPWNRCLRELQAGLVDATFNASFKPERLNYGAYPMKDGLPDELRRIATLSYSLYAMKDSQVRWDGLRISNIVGNIGAPAGYSIIDDLTAQQIQVEEASTTRVNLIKLIHGRLAAVAAQDVTADRILKTEPAIFSDVIKLTPPLVSKAYYMMISDEFIAKHPALAERIWDTLAIIREERIEKIAERYVN